MSTPDVKKASYSRMSVKVYHFDVVTSGRLYRRNTNFINFFRLHII